MLKLAFVLCFSAFVAASPVSDDQSRSGRIVGGTNAVPGQFPFMASVRTQGVHICGGTVISNRWVLSAAHCTRTLAAGSTTIVVGSYNRLAGTSHGVSRIANNPVFEARLNQHDISLVETDTAIIFNSEVQPATLGSLVLVAGTLVTIVGFGQTSENGPLADTLQSITAPTISNNICRTRFGIINAARVQDEHVCTQSPAGQGMCFGDGGTPVVVDNQVVAVNSWGIPCATGSPDVHTRVGPYRAWIRLVAGV